MLAATNLKEKLNQNRSKRLNNEFLADQATECFKIAKPQNRNSDGFDINRLDAGRIYHLNDIKSLCLTYRLRFLDVHYFKGELPAEANEQIASLEASHDISLDHLKIVAPSKMFALQNADDPLLFAPIYGGYYYLVHKWGNDLHPLRRWLVWPFRSFENLVFTVFLVSILLTLLLPMDLFTQTQSRLSERLMLFLFTFKAVGAIVLYYGFAKGKNFNSAIWNSKYYNA
ncbi:MAG: hypothetical protein ABJM06_05340 [Gilvibacter sp.]